MMKRLRAHVASPQIGTRTVRTAAVPHRRAGSVFEYYFAYLLLTSLILSAAGFCIHLLMKAFDEQSSASRFVSSTLSVSRQLRSDDEAAVSRQVVDGRLQLSLQKSEATPEGVVPAADDVGAEQVEWRAEKCVLVRRRVTATGSFENRFVFPFGTTFRMFVDGGQRCVVLVRDPLPPNMEPESAPDGALLTSPSGEEPQLPDGLVETSRV